MRKISALAGFGPARFNHHQGLLAGKFADGLPEGTPVGHTLDIQSGHTGFRIFGKVGQQLNFVQVGPVSIGNKFGNADALLFGPG